MYFTRTTFLLSMALPVALCIPADIAKLKVPEVKPIAADLSKLDLSKIDLSKLKPIDICKTKPILCSGPIKICQEPASGPIRSKWESVGGAAVLGCSYDSEPTVVAGVGSKHVFKNGAIYLPQGWRVAYALTGAMFKAFTPSIEDQLGFPLSEPVPMLGGQGSYIRFQRGYIQDHPSTGINIVKKAEAGQPGLKFQSEGGAPSYGKVLRVTYSGQMHIRDDENWPESDEFADYVLPPSPQNLLSAFPSVTFPLVDRCAGGEVRITVEITADRVTEAEIPEGAVTINGHAKLYEGGSCSTTDLETEQRFSFLLLPGQNQVRDVSLVDGSGDAQIHMNFNVVVA